MTIPQRRSYFIGLLTFEGLNNLAALYISSLLSKSNTIHTYSTRLSSTDGLTITFPKLTLFKQSFEYTAPLLWNSLPSNIRKYNNLKQFKLQYRNTL